MDKRTDGLILLSKHRPSAADHPAEGLRRFYLIVEYDGTDYCGWQRQINGPSVQQMLEEALLRLTGEEIAVTGSSRTDAGVHAMGLCAHFDSATRIPPEKIAFALNTMLPPDIRIRESGLAPEGFHARYSACGKVYRYRFFNSRHDCAIGRQYAAHVPLPLDVEAMNREAQALCGTHDFEAFAASGSVVKSTVRTIYRVQVTRSGDDVTLLVLGDGFLYNMARAMAGTVVYAAEGKIKPSEIGAILDSGNRTAAGPTVPPGGLYMTHLWYDDGVENFECTPVL